jgi:hypothetical protein
MTHLREKSPKKLHDCGGGGRGPSRTSRNHRMTECLDSGCKVKANLLISIPE